MAIVEKKSPTKYVGWLRPANETEVWTDDAEYAFLIPFARKMHRIMVRTTKDRCVSASRVCLQVPLKSMPREIVRTAANYKEVREMLPVLLLVVCE